MVQDENKHVKHESLLHTAKNMKLEKVETLPSDFFSKDGLTFTETFPNKPIEKDIALRRVMFSYRGWMKNSGLMPDYLRTKKMVPVAFTIHLEKKYGETESEKCLKPIESSINTQGDTLCSFVLTLVARSHVSNSYNRVSDRLSACLRCEQQNACRISGACLFSLSWPPCEHLPCSL